MASANPPSAGPRTLLRSRSEPAPLHAFEAKIRGRRAVATAMRSTFKRLLADRGYAVTKLDHAAAPSLSSYLRDVLARLLLCPPIRILDSDPETVRTVHGIISADDVSFDPPDATVVGENGVLIADLAQIAATPPGLASSWLKAPVIILRVKAGACWAGEIDLLEAQRQMQEHGLELADLLHGSCTSPVGAAQENVYCAFERGGPAVVPTDRDRRRRHRMAESLYRLGTPIASSRRFHRLTTRGGFGFAAGIYNPGALVQDGHVLLVARGERTPWAVQKRSGAAFRQSCQPLLLAMRDDRLVDPIEVTFHEADHAVDARYEDFRLFAHQGQIYSNHSVIDLRAAGGMSPIDPERLPTRVAISQLDRRTSTFRHLGAPCLDLPLSPIEKNWAMFSTGDRVHLIYSFNPYRLFTTSSLAGLSFTAEPEIRLELPLIDDGLALRNSINPIEYDAQHLLHLVHKVYAGKYYVFWAVLIDRRTLRPVRFSRRPLLRAGASADASIVYATSAIARDEEVLIFAGIDDCSIGYWRLPRSEIDRHWIEVTA